MVSKRKKQMWRIVRRARLTGRVTRRHATGLRTYEEAVERLKTLEVRPNTDREHVVIESYLPARSPSIRAQDVKAPMGRARFWRGG